MRRLGTASSALLLAAFSTVHAQVAIRTIAGGGPYPAGAAAVAAPMGAPHSTVVDAAGNLLIAAGNLNLILKVSPSGVVSVVAGNGAPGFSGDGGPATAASLWNPDGVTLDGDGNLFISDPGNRRVRRVDALTGIITTVAGGGTSLVVDGIPATAGYVDPAGTVAVDAAGNLFIADINHARMRRVDAATGIITTVAGIGLAGFAGDGFPATSAQLNNPVGAALDGAGNLYVADSSNNRIRRVSAATGIINTVAGGGPCCAVGDGGPATSAVLNNPSGVAVDAAGNLLVADTFGRRIRRVDAVTGIITTVAGDGTDGFGGDGGSATAARLRFCYGVALDPGGNIYIADSNNNRIRRVDAGTGIISTVAGSGYLSAWGDGGPAELAGLGAPTGIALDAPGNIFIADSDNNNVRRIDAATGIITTVAGTGEGIFTGDGGSAAAAALRGPLAVAVDGFNHLLIADTGNNRVRRVDAVTGIITTVAGNGTVSFSGDGGPAIAAAFRRPSGIAADAAGNFYVSDHFNRRVRRVDAATGIIETFAGDGTSTGGDASGQATNASIPEPLGLALEGGYLFIADAFEGRVRRVKTGNGTIRTVAGGGLYFGEGGAATSAYLVYPVAVAADTGGNFFLVDQRWQLVRRVDGQSGTINTVAGFFYTNCCQNGGFDGDWGPPTLAHLNFPSGVAVDPAGDLLIADTQNRRIRKVGVPDCFDRDGDGFGLPGNSACPGGAQDDCDDAQSARFPGNLEICDGIDNDCDDVVPAIEADTDLDGVRVCGGDCDDSNGGAFAVPAAITGLDVVAYSPNDQNVEITWTNQSATAGSGTVYDVFSGPVIGLQPSGDFSTGACFFNDKGGPYFFSFEVPSPAPGQATYFVMRAQNACPGGTGTYGSAARDQSVAGSAAACP